MENKLAEKGKIIELTSLDIDFEAIEDELVGEEGVVTFYINATVGEYDIPALDKLKGIADRLGLESLIYVEEMTM